MKEDENLKAVITCAGLGVRLLPFTKELPKEMSPVFYQSKNGMQTKPLVQLIFENLFDAGIREFCFVGGKNRKIIESHFTPNDSKSNIMELFYEKLLDSNIDWVTQNSPNGFGDAVKYTKSFVGSDNFILQAGDVSTPPNKISIIKKLSDQINNTEMDAIISVKHVDDPKRHGIVTLLDENNITSVTSAIEKPETPLTDLGIMPIYGFTSKIFDCLENILPGKNNEIQITDAIQKLIDTERKVMAIRVDDEEFWDVGTADAFWASLNKSHSLIEKI